jgi:hypothetical protein
MGAGVALLVYPSVGALVVSRRPKNAVGYILLGLGIILEVQIFASAYSSYARSRHPDLPAAEMVGDWLTPWSIGPTVILGLVLLVLLFPDGRLPASHFRRRGVDGGYRDGAGVPLVVHVVRSDRPRPIRNDDGTVRRRAPLLELRDLRVRGLGATAGRRSKRATAAQVVRLRRRVVPGRRLFLTMADEQTSEWLVFAVIVGGLSAIPVAVGIAMLRYRLYDVDVVINRTLVYGSLTVLLVVVYLGVVTATQAVFHTLTGQERLPQLAIVASTLVIAAIFNPLRRRIQSFIDRRFYRRKYDAVRTLEAFSATLRDETDLEALNDDLVGVVRETMQPAHVSVWLRPDTAVKKEEVPG